MTVAKAYNCRVCGAQKTLLTELPDTVNDPWVVSKVEGGKYGPAAKTVHENNPEARILASQEVFDCRCGHVESFSVVTMIGLGGVIFRSEIFCPRCGGHMNCRRDLPNMIPCDICRNFMIGSPEIKLN